MSGHTAPGATPGATPDDEGDRWLIAIEVAALIGRSERTARTWVAERNIPARAGRPERWSECAIRAHLSGQRGNPGGTPETAPEIPPGLPCCPGEPIEAAFRVAPEELERAIARTGEKYIGDIQTIFAQVAALYEQRLADRDALITTIREEKDAVIAELRRRAEEAEAARDRLTAAQAAPAAPGAPEAPTPDNPGGAPAAGFWARVRRMFGGG